MVQAARARRRGYETDINRALREYVHRRGTGAG